MFVCTEKGTKGSAEMSSEAETIQIPSKKN
jgi:hypothetical protein